MSIDWKKYNLEDNPFLPVPAINIWAIDKRLNGMLFCKEIVQEQYNKLLKLIKRKINIIYVNSSTIVLGTGKSALMASIYWKLKEEGENVIWVEATGGLSSSPTLGRIVDSIVAQGIFETMQNTIGDITYKNIRDLLKKYYNTPSPTLVSALIKVFNLEPGETAKKFANIRRSILISSAIELFGYLLSLMLACGIGRPTIFIDQFEEFVESHIGPSQLRKLGDDVNDLIRSIQDKATLVLSLHPSAEKTLMSAAGISIRTFAPINDERMVRVQPLKPNDGIQLTSYYISQYRIKNSKKHSLYPFSENVVGYICQASQGTPRSLIIALHNALLEGAEQGYVDLDDNFLSDPINHSKILWGIPNNWKTFLKDKVAK